MRYLLSALLCFIFVFPAYAAPDSSAKPSAQALLKQNEALTLELQELLRQVLTLRSAELDKMHEDVLEEVERWEDDEVDMDGESLQVLLNKAYRVAEARNLPVTEMQALFEQAKKMILRADYASLCGGGKELKDAFIDAAKSLEEAVTRQSADHYFLVADRVEGRMQCEQKHRLEAFKGGYRHFIRALLADSPGEAINQLREFTKLIQHLNEAEAGVLVADAERLTNEFGKADIVLKMIPGVGNAFDVWDLYTGEDMAGEKLSTFSKGLTWVGLLYPKAFGMALGYVSKGIVGAGKVAIKAAVGSVKLGGKATTKSIGFMWKLATAPKQTVNQLAKNTGKNVAALQEQALSNLRWLKGAYPELAEQGAELAAAQANRILSYAQELADAVSPASLVTNSVDEIVQRTGRPPSWVKGFRRAAKDTDSVIFTRSFNSNSSPLYAKGMAEPKPIFIKGKSSRNPLLMGTIPADAQLSKAGDAAKLNEMTEMITREYEARGMDPKDAAKVASRRVKKLIKEGNAKNAQAIKDGYAVKIDFVNPDGNSVVRGTDVSGQTRVFEKLKDGTFRDEAGRLYPADQVKNTKPVKVLAHPDTGKVYAPDEDLLGMGHGAGKSRNMQSDSISGTYDERNKTVMHQANIYVRLQEKLLGHKGHSPSSHGSAQFFNDALEQGGFMAYFPDGTMVNVGSQADLKQLFRKSAELGYEGLEWNPHW